MIETEDGEFYTTSSWPGDKRRQYLAARLLDDAAKAEAYLFSMRIPKQRGAQVERPFVVRAGSSIYDRR